MMQRCLLKLFMVVKRLKDKFIILQRTTHIIVATPGRLIDLIERGEVHLKEIKTLSFR